MELVSDDERPWRSQPWAAPRPVTTEKCVVLRMSSASFGRVATATSSTCSFGLSDAEYDRIRSNSSSGIADSKTACVAGSQFAVVMSRWTIPSSTETGLSGFQPREEIERGREIDHTGDRIVTRTLKLRGWDIAETGMQPAVAVPADPRDDRQLKLAARPPGPVGDKLGLEALGHRVVVGVARPIRATRGRRGR
jgi:hypothetical protein